MKKLFFIAFVYLISVSCIERKAKKITYKSDAKNMTYLALGDSYTIGESVNDTERFPVQTVQLLKEKKLDVSNPDIVAVTGWTTSDLLNALNNDPPPLTYSFVTLLIGVNNQYQSKSLEEYETEFAELLHRSISYADNNKNHVFVLSIPDYSVTPFASNSNVEMIAKQIDEFNAANKKISLNAGVHYIDITPISRDAKKMPSLIAVDGLHPSGIQYKRWSDLLAHAIIKEFK